MAQFPHHTPAGPYPVTLEVVKIHPVISNQGIGEEEDLPMVTGVSERLHVPGHLSGEYKFTGAFTLHSKTFTHRKIVILKTQDCLHRFPY
jgi:hypothetical protein